MKRYFFLFLTCVIVTQGCANNSTKVLTEQEKAIITEEVKARVVDYIDAFKKLDIERMLDFWANTEGFVYAGDGSLVVGYDKYSIQIKDLIPNTEKVNYIEQNEPYVYILARDAASYTMEYRWSLTMKSGDTLNAKGSWMYVFKKFDDTWRVVHSAGAHIYN
jgi:ketosteroid isomerase-like protein